MPIALRGSSADEVHVARAFVGAEALRNEAQQGLASSACARTRHDEGRDALAEVVVWDPHDGDLSHRRVLEQARLDLPGADAIAPGLDQVGAPATKIRIAPSSVRVAKSPV